MTGGPPVGVHDHFTSGQSGVADRTSDDETARRVDDELVIAARIGKDRLEDVFAEIGLEAGRVEVLGMLGGNQNPVHSGRLGSLISNGDLGLAVGSQIAEGLVLSHNG